MFGYPDQDGSRDGNERGGDWSIDGAGYPLVPKWAKDGSYLVFRRLKQNISLFHAFLHEHKAEQTAQAFAAELVGRWPSGAPLMRAPNADLPDCAKDNEFAFARRGRSVPRNAHIRKVNPRDDIDAAIGGGPAAAPRHPLRSAVGFNVDKPRR